MRSYAILAALLAASLGAQTTVLLPNPPTLAANTNLPLSAGIGRYQQWFAPNQVSLFGVEPTRLTQIDILAGTAATITTTLDLQVSVAHAAASGITSQFDQNLIGGAVTVIPRRTVALTPAAPGLTVCTLTFATPFTWDGLSSIVVDIRLFGNGQGNQPFNFDLRGTSQALGLMTRLYQGNNANATSGVLSAGQGLYMRFSTRPGAVVPFGNGCRGVNLITPVGTVLSLPQPGITWMHRLDNAAAQHFCALVIGTSRTQWVASTGTFPLPIDLTPLGGFGCSLLVAPEIVELAVTVGSQGAATATIGIAIPPLPSFIGISAFSQWLVEDPAALNTVMSTTAGLWSIVAPVGG